jgi:hypothetical protein
MSVSASRQHVQFKLDGSVLEVEYATKGHVSSQRIEADFGAMGRINVRLHLVRYPPDPPHEGRCKGRAPLYEEGSYSGTIKFRGLGPDVPLVSATRGHVYVTHRFRQVCKRRHIRPPRSGKKEELKSEVGVLNVSGQVADRTVFLQALEFTPMGQPIRSQGYLSATVVERLEGVRITRRRGTPISHESFVLSRPGEVPETAEIKLPKPFADHAFYSRSPGTSPSWSGDLSVDLPVVGRIPLTGVGFTATLCRAFSVAMLESCRSTQTSTR